MCRPGHYSSTGLDPCTECSPGRYQPSYGATACLPCAQGSYTDINASTECNMCAPGSSQSRLGATECELCDYDFYQHMSGAVDCIPCPMATHTRGVGSTNALACECKSLSDLCRVGECTSAGHTSSIIIFPKIHSNLRYDLPGHFLPIIMFVKHSELNLGRKRIVSSTIWSQVHFPPKVTPQTIFWCPALDQST